MLYGRMVTFRKGFSLDCLHSVGAGRGNGCDLTFDQLVKDHVYDGNDDKFRQKWLFYKLFSLYLRESCSRGIIRPVPVLLGDGHTLDLYKLFSLVKEKGGYAFVSKEGLWSYVAKELGLNLEVLTSVKLVYDKYLNEFEGWLRKNWEEKNFNNVDHGCQRDFESMQLELEKEYRFRGLSCPNPEWRDGGYVQLESYIINKKVDVVLCKREINVLVKKNQYAIFEDVHSDDDEKFRNGVEDDLATFDPEVVRREFKAHKRKRDALSGMLSWMRYIAKDPFDRSIKPIPKPSKWQEYKGTEFWIQILRAREALLLKQCVEPDDGPSSLKKPKMHPSMYEDHVTLNHESTLKLRCSDRLHTFKPRSCPCCSSCSVTGNKLKNMKAENAQVEQTTAAVDLSSAKAMANPSEDDVLLKQVAVGPLFQVVVPEWSGVVSDSDNKWLGVPVWPLKYSGSKAASETDLIGRGRLEKCSCQFKGSVECVRFHIAEKRVKLKLELGSVFYHWGFDSMGEEVSLQWTTKEEKKFNDMTQSSRCSQSGCFWSNSFKYFRNKTRRNLVSYYFNVFLLQHRGHQNRSTPKAIDSDDDELEFDSLTDSFGMEAAKCLGVKLECSQNKQDTDLGQTILERSNSTSEFDETTLES